jgi:hypothetical protein
MTAAARVLRLHVGGFLLCIEAVSSYGGGDGGGEQGLDLGPMRLDLGSVFVLNQFFISVHLNNRHHK